MDSYFSTTVARTIPAEEVRTLPGYSDLTLTTASDNELLIQCSGPTFSASDKGKILWCNSELRTITSVQNNYQVLISVPFTTAPNLTAFRVVTPGPVKVSLTCTANSFLCTPDASESTFIANTTVVITANAVAMRPSGGATIAGTWE